MFGFVFPDLVFFNTIPQQKEAGLLGEMSDSTTVAKKKNIQDGT